MIRPKILRSPALLLSLLLLAPFLPLLIAPGGRVFGNQIIDNPSMFYYINEFAGRCWRHGVIPLWNPHLMLGLPFLGEGQAAIFHPLSSLFALLPTGMAINWLIALSVLLTGLFFYGYLRAVGLGAPAAVFGAVVWCYSNVLISRIYAGHLTILLELIEMPLILMLWERYRQRRSLRYLAGLAVAYGVMILAAYPQMMYIFSLFFLLYVLLQSAQSCLAAPARAGEEGRAILWLGVFVLLGAGIGLVQLLPMADFASESFRQKADYSFCSTFSFVPENLVTLLAPRFFGYSPEVGPGQYWGDCNFWEMWIYLGMLPLLLVIPGVMAAPRQRRITLGAVALIFFVVALGDFTPFFPLVYRFVPLFNLFRGPSKNMLITELCLVTFSAWGLQGLLEAAGGAAFRRRLLAALSGGAVLLAVVLGLYLYLIPGSGAPDSHWHQLLEKKIGNVLAQVDGEKIKSMAAWTSRELLRSAAFLVAALAVLALAWKFKARRGLAAAATALALADLLCVFLPLLQTYPESITRTPEDLVRRLKTAPYPLRVVAPGFYCNGVIHTGLVSPSGYTGNTLARYNNFINMGQGLPPDRPQLVDPITGYVPLLRFLSIDAEILPQEMVGEGRPVAARADGLALIFNPETFPRAFLAAAPAAVENSPDALEYVLTRDRDLLHNPVVEAAGTPPALPLTAQEGVKIVAFAPTRVELAVQAAHPRLLVLCEMYEKSWTATVNDKPAGVLPANYLFRGVEVPPGDSRVVFEYRPAAFRWGAALALLSLATILAAGLWDGRRRPIAGLDG